MAQNQVKQNWNKLKSQPVSELKAKEEFNDKLRTMALVALLIKKEVITTIELQNQMKAEYDGFLNFFNKNQDILNEMKNKEHKENRPDYSG